ncbi:MAG: hypothetical protein ACI8Y3_001101, partial [Paraglaciecola sp.]
KYIDPLYRIIHFCSSEILQLNVIYQSEDLRDSKLYPKFRKTIDTILYAILLSQYAATSLDSRIILLTRKLPESS